MQNIAFENLDSRLQIYYDKYSQRGAELMLEGLWGLPPSKVAGSGGEAPSKLSSPDLLKFNFLHLPGLSTIKGQILCVS